jgi:4-hydroxybenzoate polyprenyltransferase
MIFKDSRFHQYFLLMRLHRPIGIYLLLHPTLWALWLASNGNPSWELVFIFVLGVILMRSAGCVINDFADRRVDPHVRRTKDRPIANGNVSPQEASYLFIFLILLAFLLVLQLNLFTILLSIPAVCLAAIYPFMKRYTHFPQIILGAAFSWGIPMVFSAQLNQVPLLAWWLFLTALLWTVAYDTQYAMTDREDDLKIGVKSTAIFFGQFDKLIIGILQILVLISLSMIGFYQQLSFLYQISVLIMAGFFIYQQYLIKDRDPARCFQAFLNNHWAGLVVFLGLFLNYTLT